MHGLHVNFFTPLLSTGTALKGKNHPKIAFFQKEMRSFVSQGYDAWHFTPPWDADIINYRL
jgi:hypothetical protein